jgi:hypothetical protein
VVDRPRKLHSQLARHLAKACQAHPAGSRLWFDPCSKTDSSCDVARACPCALRRDARRRTLRRGTRKGKPGLPRGDRPNATNAVAVGEIEARRIVGLGLRAFSRGRTRLHSQPTPDAKGRSETAGIHYEEPKTTKGAGTCLRRSRGRQASLLPSVLYRLDRTPDQLSPTSFVPFVVFVVSVGKDLIVKCQCLTRLPLVGSECGLCAEGLTHPPMSGRIA